MGLASVVASHLPSEASQSLHRPVAMATRSKRRKDLHAAVAAWPPTQNEFWYPYLHIPSAARSSPGGDFAREDVTSKARYGTRTVTFVCHPGSMKEVVTGVPSILMEKHPTPLAYAVALTARGPRLVGARSARDRRRSVPPDIQAAAPKPSLLRSAVRKYSTA